MTLPTKAPASLFYVDIVDDDDNELTPPVWTVELKIKVFFGALSASTLLGTGIGWLVFR